MHDISTWLTSPALVLLAAVLQACGPAGEDPDASESGIQFEVVGTVSTPGLTEISGLESISGPTVVVHNDDGEPALYVLAKGELFATLHVAGAHNRDWEDLTWVPHATGRWLAIGDIGDNDVRRDSIRIYFVDPLDPSATVAVGGEQIEVTIKHELELTYPDGPRDCESMAYDPVSRKILLLTKRDDPPRLYGVDAATALEAPRLELEFLGTVNRFRPPTPDDMRRLGKEGRYVSQPTGMDINDDGTLAAVITYRSLYLFERRPEQSWAEAFNNPPREFLGPPSRNEEAIAFGQDMKSLYISTEGRNPPIYRAELPPPNH